MFLVIKSDKAILPFFHNFDRDFGTLGKGITKIRLQIRTMHPQKRLYLNSGKLGCIISVKNNRLGCLFFQVTLQIKSFFLFDRTYIFKLFAFFLILCSCTFQLPYCQNTGKNPSFLHIYRFFIGETIFYTHFL